MLAGEWATPSFDLERDAWLVRSPGGAFAAYAQRMGDPPHTDDLAFLWIGSGESAGDHLAARLTTFLAQASEARVRELSAGAPPEKEVTFGFYCSRRSGERRALLERLGYMAARGSYLMAIDPRQLAGQASPPHAVAIRTLSRGEERAAHAALEEAFPDHYRYVYEPYEEWAARTIENAGFDPALCLLASQADEIVGVVVGSGQGELAFVDALAVRRLWRNRGIAKALLTGLMAEFARRDAKRVRLYVDAQNPTGALHLYESVGMHIAQEYDLLLKALRPAGSS